MMNPDGSFQEDIQCIVPEQNGRGAIFISNLEAACNPNTLKKNNIKAVITAIQGKNLAQKIPPHMQYLYIPVIDHQSCDISIFFTDSFDFIEEQRKRTNVLVHCMAGVSRSVTLVIAYIMQKSKIPYQTAYNYVKSKRKIIHPNQSFINQLKQHQKRLFGKNQEQKLSDIQNKPTKQSESADKQMQQTRGSSKYGSIRGFYHGVTEQNSLAKMKVHAQDTKQTLQHHWPNKQNKTENSSQTKQSGVKVQLSQTHKNRQKGPSQGYDKNLRQNIRRLFSMGNSSSSLCDRSQAIR